MALIETDAASPQPATKGLFDANSPLQSNDEMIVLFSASQVHLTFFRGMKRIELNGHQQLTPLFLQRVPSTAEGKQALAKAIADFIGAICGLSHTGIATREGSADSFFTTFKR